MRKQEFIDWCVFRHDVECNQKYDNDMLYSKHLQFVAAHAHRFRHLLGSQWIESTTFTVWDCVEMACYGHDLIEDARVTYNDLVGKVGKYVADLIYCCTEEKGRDRNERHSGNYYAGLASNKVATYVKLCDIMANVTFGVLTNSKMYLTQKAEHEKTLKYLFVPEYQEMFDHLDKLFTLK